MPTLHHSLGTDGLLLRTERGVQALALADQGPLLAGAYATPAELEAAQAQRVVAELALTTPGRICLAVRDLAGLAPRDPGTPNPQYTLYRVVPQPQEGEEPAIVYGHSERLDALAEPCDFAQLWQVTEPRLAAQAADTLDSAAGWTVTAPKVLAQADDPLETRTQWTITPDSVPANGTTEQHQTTSGAVDTGANLTYLDQSGADWSAAVAAGWTSSLRWWANSHGPFTMGIPPSLQAWHTLWPGVRWDCVAAPYYYRSAAGGKGTASTPIPGEAGCVANAAPGFDPAKAWTLFAVAKGHGPRQAEQGVLFGAGFIGQSSGADAAALELHCGTATQGIRAVWGRRASRTFATALSTDFYQIVELHAAAGAAVGTWALALDGVEQAQAAVLAGETVPSWPFPPDQFVAMRGWPNSPSGATGAPFHGCLSEIILIQTDTASVRTAIRQYLAAKFAITLP